MNPIGGNLNEAHLSDTRPWISQTTFAPEFKGKRHLTKLPCRGPVDQMSFCANDVLAKCRFRKSMALCRLGQKTIWSSVIQPQFTRPSCLTLCLRLKLMRPYISTAVLSRSIRVKKMWAKQHSTVILTSEASVN